MEITYQNYLDAVYGGWLGKCIGGAIGAMQENNKGLELSELAPRAQF